MYGVRPSAGCAPFGGADRIRHRILEMWIDAMAKYETDPRIIGNIVWLAGIGRSGQQRDRVAD